MAKKTTKQTKTKAKTTRKATSKTTNKVKTKATKSGTAKPLTKLDETGRRQKSERRNNEETVGKERRKATRRRQIDPTTCERDYTDAEIEFMHALDDYKRRSGRMFPTCSEILEVLGNLGYRKVDTPADTCCQHDCQSTDQIVEKVEIA